MSSSSTTSTETGTATTSESKSATNATDTVTSSAAGDLPIDAMSDSSEAREARGLAHREHVLSSLRSCDSRGVTLSWNDLSYVIPAKPGAGQPTSASGAASGATSASYNSSASAATSAAASAGGKMILQPSSGFAQSGMLTGLMGSSGAGKSTLLDLLSGRIRWTSRVSGEVRLNGILLASSPRAFSRHVTYVQQADHLNPALTVVETVRYSAALRLPDLTADEREARVQAVLAELGLSHVQNTRVGNERMRGLSGGEKRRLSVAVELIVQPDVLFLDEPTSGLDSASSSALLRTLRAIAHGSAIAPPRCVIMSLHQPSSDCFRMLDSVIFLTRGSLVFNNSPDGVADFLAEIGAPIPRYFNPADALMDVICEREKEGKVLHLAADFQRWNVGKNAHKPIDFEAYSLAARSNSSGEHQGGGELRRASWLKQVGVITLSQARTHLRLPELFFVRLGIAVVSGVALGSVFYDPPGSAEVSGFASFFAFVCAMFIFTSSTYALDNAHGALLRRPADRRGALSRDARLFFALASELALVIADALS